MLSICIVKKSLSLNILFHCVIQKIAIFATGTKNDSRFLSLFFSEIVLCIPCCRETIEADATKYCRTCEDPEPLCDVCAQHHTCRKETKEHGISDDLQQLAAIAETHK